ncbi:MAG TPA: nucleoside monophosphate kinase [Candidatus Saccharimonadales bacterium]|nr:nucleoside monophosphate kinase [Candidatus Saccharimonadales bacterium]
MSELLTVGGKPGSGKTTVSAAAAKLIDGARHFSMGERLRGIANGNIASRYADELANSRERLAQHKAVGRPQLPVLVLEEFMAEEDGLVIVDGFPRYRNRTGMFFDMLEETGHKLVAMCHIDVSNEVADTRMAGRGQRTADVTEDADFRQRRIEDFYNEMLPVMQEIGAIAPVRHIDGHQPVDIVASQLARVAMELTSD